MNVKDYGAKGDGTTDDTVAIQAAFAAVASSGVKQQVLIPPGTYRIASGLSADLSYCSIKGHGAVIDASALSAGSALLLTGSVSLPYYQATSSIEGIELKGPQPASSWDPGNPNTVIGIKCHTAVSTGNGTSHSYFTNLSIHGFGTGLYLGSRHYCTQFANSDIFACGTGVHCPPTTEVEDAGERTTFHGCTFFNSALAIEIENDIGGYNFLFCSFDYNVKQLAVNTAKVWLTHCHIEAYKGNDPPNHGPTYPGTPITVSGAGGTLVCSGCWILLNGSGTPAHSYTIRCDAAAGQGGGALFTGCFFNNLGTPTGEFADPAGTGSVIVQNYFSYNQTDNPPLLSTGARYNLLADGSFEQGIEDNIFIWQDDNNPDLASLTLGSNIQLLRSNAEARSGTWSLEVQKSGAAGTGASFALAVPVSEGAHPSYRLYYKISAVPATTGSFERGARGRNG
ncbi:MAG: hypothetical protein HY692_01345 [Cyanobacteria bacterium NC_groundwater_1444_Ag_S-0.65um_54_12]|nr:hypothetical protein [Cyanobacteria bacterium NC_groundwater_1444_Ag_S-0.65um_54_12]